MKWPLQLAMGSGKKRFPNLPVIKHNAESISVSATRGQTARINSSFIKNQIDVFEIVVTRKSLEDKFFEITEQGMRETV